ncbi:DUF5684 domain-containing protein [uncultured Chitinophaga sp.]|jgi:hypothetical protein|uniref:DUF5684 domain-containing protein n=1 Tax=uncultured Chitinophaga sp. TaxID=339340 RepID=UPI002635D54B|nr:DUF5684 domain-containing protein [uncultured Chitinophaga sp.]
MESSSSIFGTGFFLFWLVLTIFYIYCGWKIYEKAGQPGWAVIVPLYNVIVQMRIIGKPWWWLLLMFIPVVNLVIAIWAANLLSKSFGKSEGFTLGLIFLGFIFYPILAFDKSIQYQGPAGNPNATSLGDQIQSIGSDVK